MSMNKVLAVCLLGGAVLSCGSDSKSKSKGDRPGLDGSAGADSRDDGDGPDEPADPAAPSTYDEVTSVAKLIYDAVEAGEDVTPHIEAVLEAFGVPILEPDDEDSAIEQIEAGLPFVTTRVVEEMAAAYAAGRLVELEGFVDGLVEQGVELGFPFNVGGQKLDASIFSTMLYSFTIGGELDPEVPMEPGSVLPALVRELGQERLRRSSELFLDPVWGDGRLDPLQFTLLTFTIFAEQGGTSAKSLRAAPKTRFQANPAADFIKDQIKNKIKDKVEGQITSTLQQVTEVPLDKKDAAKVSVCGSLILYGHKITMTNTPDLLWHAPKKPNITTVSLTLTFEDDYYDNWARAVLGSAVTDLTGCKFPRKGPIGNKPIKWSVSSGLQGHGSFDVMASMTDEGGEALASWRTVKDEYPEACQVFENQRDAVGATEATVGGLLPGWSTVETIVTFLNPNTGTQGNDPLTVLYYEVDYDDTCHTE
jgi:hypothetical protein